MKLGPMFTGENNPLKAMERRAVITILFSREVLTNQNATFNDTDGTVTYQPHREIIFAPEKSVGDPKTDRVVTTNIALVVRSFPFCWDNQS